MIKLILLDIDGVLTNGKKYYSRDAVVQLKSFCDKDWTAIKRFQALGVNIIFISGDPFNEAIAKNRNLEIIINRQDGGHKDKSLYLEEICTRHGVSAKEVAFVGDDIFDLELMLKVGYQFCPSDAPRVVRESATILECCGGDNVVMHLFDYLSSMNLIPQFTFSEHLKKVYELDLKEKF